MKSSRKCAKNVCEICTNAEIVKGVFGKKFMCRMGKKKSQGKCFYFTCAGSSASYCQTCPNFKKVRDNNTVG